MLGALALLLLPTDFAAHMEALAPPPPIREPLRILRGTIGRNATLARLLESSLPPAGVHLLVEAAKPAYNLARLSVGRPFGLAVTKSGILASFTYGIDELRTLRVTRRGDSLHAEVVTRAHETRVDRVGGTITSSLFAAIGEAGEQDQLALDLADVFAWDVDFNTEIQKGDSFRVAVEKLTADGTFLRYGRILAAEFTRGSRVLKAVRYEGAAGEGFYAPDGSPLRKAFLRSPLQFTRISSGFTRSRFHPILGHYTAHLGIDYAAPVGTPVRASADGVVLLAGWSGGYGKTVRLRHTNGFETLYGHLSRIDVRAGQRVSQGSLVGAVGTTGLSTGPHLDYRMIRNGTYVNPLTIQLPPAEPVPAVERASFESRRDERLALLDGPHTAPNALVAAP